MLDYMKKEHLNEYAALYKKVFNSAPWFDKWTTQLATKRIQEMMDTPNFFGLASYIETKLIGCIWGRSEQYFDGINFQIQEFYIENDLQNQGIGTELLNSLIDELKNKGIVQIFLLTSKGETTEGFYNKKGFTTSTDMVLLYNRVEDK